jgi:probable F420-dependent oxidoreductase
MELGAGVSAAELGNDPAAIRDFAQAIEGQGFDSMFTNDHVVGGHPDRLRSGEKLHTYDVACHEPFVLLAFVAGATTRLGLATAIVILPQRQTVLVAKQAAELDLLCGGRLRLGVGIGRNWMEYEALNEDFGNRGRRMEEQIAVMRRLWSDELVTFEGHWHKLDRVGLNPMPVQRPIPVWLGTFTGAFDKPIERAARLSDGWMPQFGPSELAPLLDKFHGYARAAGRDPSTIGIECTTRIAPDDSPDAWAERARSYAALGATHLKAMPAGPVFGSLQQRVDVLGRWHDTVRSALA